jgi:hypothetical protein
MPLPLSDRSAAYFENASLAEKSSILIVPEMPLM